MFPENISSLEWALRFLSFYCWVEEQDAKSGRITKAPIHFEKIRDIIRTGTGELTPLEQTAGQVYVERWMKFYDAKASDIVYMLDQEILRLKDAEVL